MDSFKEFFEVVKFLAPYVGKIIGGALGVIGQIAGVVIDVCGNVLGAIKPVLNTIIDSVNLVIRGLNIISPFKDIPSIPKITSSPKITDLGMIPGTDEIKIPAVVVPKMPDFKGSSGGTKDSPSSGGGKGVSVAAESGAQAAIALSPSVAEVGALGGLAGGVIAGVNITINQGIVGDQESAARAVVDVLNNSFYRGTGGANTLVAL